MSNKKLVGYDVPAEVIYAAKENSMSIAELCECLEYLALVYGDEVDVFFKKSHNIQHSLEIALRWAEKEKDALEEDSKSKEAAKLLRQIAGFVEECEVKNREIEINQFSTQKDRATNDDWIHYMKTGDVSVSMHLSLYNPKLDEERNHGS